MGRFYNALWLNRDLWKQRGSCFECRSHPYCANTDTCREAVFDGLPFSFVELMVGLFREPESPGVPKEASLQACVSQRPFIPPLYLLAGLSL